MSNKDKLITVLLSESRDKKDEQFALLINQIISETIKEAICEEM